MTDSGGTCVPAESQSQLRVAERACKDSSGLDVIVEIVPQDRALLPVSHP